MDFGKVHFKVDEGLGRMPENEQRKALESQLKFRKTVLKQRFSIFLGKMREENMKNFPLLN